MPVTIAGMHRSGTSMVARMLNLAGLDLGPVDQLIQPAADNPEGFWESVPFVSLNQDLMEELGGGWHAPADLPPGWEQAESLNSWRERAARLPAQLGLKEPWGWKDPRNSITLPFWRSLWPSLRIVVCVRHPLEVASSLLERNQFPLLRGLNLWLDYYRRLFDATSPAERVVTHYESYFRDPEAELRRVLTALEMPANEERVRAGCAAVVRSLRHSEFGRDDLDAVEAPEGVAKMYSQLLEEAALPPENTPRNPTAVRHTRALIRQERLNEKQQRRIEELETQVLDLARDLDQTQHRLNLWMLFGDQRDRAARLMELRLNSKRHRYADKVAGFLQKVADPLGRKYRDRSEDDLLHEAAPSARPTV